MQEVLSNYKMPNKVVLRTDNGSQFEAGLFREYLKEMRIEHEFTHIATPEENCYIEAFHSIVENAVVRKYEFESLEDAKSTFNRFMNFYNQERIHRSLKNQSPNKFLQNREKPILRPFPCSEALSNIGLNKVNKKVESLSYN